MLWQPLLRRSERTSQAASCSLRHMADRQWTEQAG
jgi:hypothetical protein